MESKSGPLNGDPIWAHLSYIQHKIRTNREEIRCPFRGNHVIKRAHLAHHLRTCPYRWPPSSSTDMRASEICQIKWEPQQEILESLEEYFEKMIREHKREKEEMKKSLDSISEHSSISSSILEWSSDNDNPNTSEEGYWCCFQYSQEFDENELSDRDTDTDNISEVNLGELLITEDLTSSQMGPLFEKDETSKDSSETDSNQCSDIDQLKPEDDLESDSSSTIETNSDSPKKDVDGGLSEVKDSEKVKDSGLGNLDVKAITESFVDMIHKNVRDIVTTHNFTWENFLDILFDATDSITNSTDITDTDLDQAALKYQHIKDAFKSILVLFQRELLPTIPPISAKSSFQVPFCTNKDHFCHKCRRDLGKKKGVAPNAPCRPRISKPKISKNGHHKAHSLGSFSNLQMKNKNSLAKRKSGGPSQDCFKKIFKSQTNSRLSLGHQDSKLRGKPSQDCFKKVSKSQTNSRSSLGHQDSKLRGRPSQDCFKKVSKSQTNSRLNLGLKQGHLDHKLRGKKASNVSNHNNSPISELPSEKIQQVSSRSSLPRDNIPKQSCQFVPKIRIRAANLSKNVHKFSVKPLKAKGFSALKNGLTSMKILRNKMAARRHQRRVQKIMVPSVSTNSEATAKANPFTNISSNNADHDPEFEEMVEKYIASEIQKQEDNWHGISHVNTTTIPDTLNPIYSAETIALIKHRRAGLECPKFDIIDRYMASIIPCPTCKTNDLEELNATLHHINKEEQPRLRSNPQKMETMLVHSFDKGSSKLNSLRRDPFDCNNEKVVGYVTSSQPVKKPEKQNFHVPPRLLQTMMESFITREPRVPKEVSLSKTQQDSTCLQNGGISSVNSSDERVHSVDVSSLNCSSSNDTFKDDNLMLKKELCYQEYCDYYVDNLSTSRQRTENITVERNIMGTETIFTEYVEQLRRNKVGSEVLVEPTVVLAPSNEEVTVIKPCSSFKSSSEEEMVLEKITTVSEQEKFRRNIKKELSFSSVISKKLQRVVDLSNHQTLKACQDDLKILTSRSSPAELMKPKGEIRISWNYFSEKHKRSINSHSEKRSKYCQTIAPKKEETATRSMKRIKWQDIVQDASDLKTRIRNKFKTKKETASHLEWNSRYIPFPSSADVSSSTSDSSTTLKGPSSPLNFPKVGNVQLRKEGGNSKSLMCLLGKSQTKKSSSFLGSFLRRSSHCLDSPGVSRKLSNLFRKDSSNKLKDQNLQQGSQESIASQSKSCATLTSQSFESKGNITDSIQDSDSVEILILEPLDNKSKLSLKSSNSRKSNSAFKIVRDFTNSPSSDLNQVFPSYLDYEKINELFGPAVEQPEEDNTLPN